MKKILVAIALVMVISFGAKAQGGYNDGFFHSNDWEELNSTSIRTGDFIPALPGLHGIDGDFYAPMGSGLLILGALGAGYAVARRKKNS